MTRKPAVGIDLGGTKIHAGVVAPGGETLGEVRVPTEPDRETDVVVGNMVSAARRAMQEAGVQAEGVDGAGLGSPAPLDIKAGVLISPNNLPSLHGCPIVERLSDELGVPVTLDNDANCLGLAEARFGAGKGAEVCCGLTLGTGMGAFMVIRGEVYGGPHGAGVEIWCSPHQGDFVEEKVSGRGITRTYFKLTEKEASARELADLAREGDEQAIETWQEFARNTAVSVAWLSNTGDPDVFVLGGSIAKAWDLFGETLVREARKYINEVTRNALRIVPAELGDAAGMLGAAALVLQPDPDDFLPNE